MTVLASAVIDRVIRKTRRTTQVTSLDGAIDDTVTSLILTSVEYIASPALLEIGSELLQVQDVDSASRQVTVIRGFLGTISTAHADGAVAFISPEFLRHDIFDLINECVDDLFPDLYKLTTKALVAGADIGYELDAGSRRPLAVWAQRDSSLKSWVPVADWEFQPQADTSVFPSGVAIMIRASIARDAAVQVVIPTPFTRLTAEADDLEAVAGLQTYMSELPYYYAIAYTLAERENQRSQITSGQAHQRAQDVPAFSALQTANWYRARYDEKKLEAMQRLATESRRILKSGYGS